MNAQQDMFKKICEKKNWQENLWREEVKQLHSTR